MFDVLLSLTGLAGVDYCCLVYLVGCSFALVFVYSVDCSLLVDLFVFEFDC